MATKPTPETGEKKAAASPKGAPSVQEELTEQERKKEDKARKKLEDTVRNRKRSQKAATQRYLPFAEIRNDTVILKNGGLRAILLVEPINYNLKSETEQMGIIEGYKSFINTLNFPVQIVMRSSNVNIDPYIIQIRENAEQQENDLLREQSIAYADFIERIVEVAEIMQKRFYVIVPLDDEPEKKPLFSQFFAWMGIDDSVSKALNRSKRFSSLSVRLNDQITIVESGLQNVGLATKRLKTKELIELFYQIYNPETSQEQKLPKDGNLNTENLVL